MCNQDLARLETLRVERKANEEEKERTMMMCVHAFRESPKSASWARNWVKIECCDYANQDVGSFFSLSSRRLLFTRPRSPAPHHVVGFFFRESQLTAAAFSVFIAQGSEREIRKRRRSSRVKWELLHSGIINSTPSIFNYQITSTSTGKEKSRLQRKKPPLSSLRLTVVVNSLLWSYLNAIQNK